MPDEWNLVTKGEKKSNGVYMTTCLHCKKTWQGDAGRIRAHFGALTGIGCAPCIELKKPEDQQSESLRDAVTLCKKWQAEKNAAKAAKDARTAAAASAELSRKGADEARKRQLVLENYEDPSGRRRIGDPQADAVDDATLKFFARHGIPFSAAEVSCAILFLFR